MRVDIFAGKTVRELHGTENTQHPFSPLSLYCLELWVVTVFLTKRGRGFGLGLGSRGPFPLEQCHKRRNPFLGTGNPAELQLGSSTSGCIGL